MVTTMANTISHPTAVNLQGALWYTAGHLLSATSGLVGLYGLVTIMRWPTLELKTLVLVLPAILGLGVARPYAFRSAWGEVPGAFGQRLVTRGDEMNPERPHAIDIASQVLRTGVFLAGVAYIASRVEADPTGKAVLLGLFAGAMVAYTFMSAGRGVVEGAHEHWWYRFQPVDLVAALSLGVVIRASLPTAAAEVSVYYWWNGFVLAGMCLVLWWVTKAVIRTSMSPPEASAAVSDWPKAVLVRDDEEHHVTVDHSGWLRTWVRYLPLTLCMSVGIPLGLVLLRDLPWADAAVWAATCLMASLVLVPVGVRIVAPRPLRDDDTK